MQQSQSLQSKSGATQVSSSNNQKLPNERIVLNGICLNTINANNTKQQLNAAAVLQQLIYQQQLINESAAAVVAAATAQNNPTSAQAAAAAAAATRYKTELCRSFQENGTCKYSDKCQFAHGFNELRSMTRHPKYKTELCRTFHAAGYCPYGPRCHFVHDTTIDPSKQNKNPSSPKQTPQTITLTLNLMPTNSGSHLLAAASQPIATKGPSSSNSSSSSSSSTSPLSNILNTKFNNASNQFNQVNTKNLLMCASDSLVGCNPQITGDSNDLLSCFLSSNQNQMAGSVDSAFGAFSSSSSSSRHSNSSGSNSANISPPSSRSISPESFMLHLPSYVVESGSGATDASNMLDEVNQSASEDSSALIVNQILNNIYSN
jgi:hypothetical protein